MKTPAQKLGYFKGQRFVVTDNSRDGAFGKGSVVELYKDDGTDFPLFKLITGACNYRHVDGADGAYLHLDKVKPLAGRQGLQMKYFVLEPEGNDIYAQASREALLHYAKVIAEADSELATELLAWARREEAK